MLARADLKLKPGEFLAIMIGSSAGTALIAWIAFGKMEFTPLGGVFAIAGAIGGLFIPRIFVGRQETKRLKDSFPDQLPDAIEPKVHATLKVQQYGLVVDQPRHDVRGN